MITPIQRTRTVSLDTPLPAAWLRLHQTQAEQNEQATGIIWRTGPQGLFRKQLISAIDNAEEVVLLAAFLLSDSEIADALLRAVERKVRVYILTASEARLGKLVDEDAEFEQRMVKEHEGLLDRLAGRVVLRTAGHLHAKFLITDPATYEARGFISTANFNPALRESVELGVELDSAQAGELARWFNRSFWLEAEYELVEKGRLAAVNAPPGQPATPTGVQIVGTGRDDHTLRDRVIDRIAKAKDHLLICSYGVEENHEVVRAIESRALAGVEVTLLTRPRPAVLAGCRRLAEAGVRIIGHDKLHAKAIVSDAGALVMTANLETHGLDEGFEVGIDLSHTEAHRELEATLRGWADIFPWQFAHKAERSEHIGEICLADEGLRTGVRRIDAEHHMTLPPTYALSLLEMEEATEPDLPLPKEKEAYYQQVRYEWEILPPKLPAGAKERMEEYEEEVVSKKGKRRMEKKRRSLVPPVYDHVGQVYVMLNDEAMLPKVREQARKLNARVVLP